MKSLLSILLIFSSCLVSAQKLNYTYNSAINKVYNINTVLLFKRVCVIEQDGNSSDCDLKKTEISIAINNYGIGELILRTHTLSDLVLEILKTTKDENSIRFEMIDKKNAKCRAYIVLDSKDNITMFVFKRLGSKVSFAYVNEP